MKTILLLATSLLLMSSSLSSQDEAMLKNYFEGKMVTLKLDMPATKEGVEIYPNKSTPLDFGDYSKRIKEHGISIYSGDKIMITTVKLKKKHIEFQLGGGGYGTMGDDRASVDRPYLSESSEEKALKAKIKKTTNSSTKEKLEDELDELKKARRLEQRKINMEAETLKETKEQSIREKASGSGSRFNIRYDQRLTKEETSIESIKTALSKYIAFGQGPPLANTSKPSMKSSGDIHKGMTWSDAAALYGAPKDIDQRTEGTLNVLECTFEKGSQIIKALFVEEVLVKYSISSM